MTKPFKIAQSVLVVIYTPDLDVLLIRRADTPDTVFWQSVTGSKDALSDSFEETAIREVGEETGIDCRAGTALHAGLQDWQMENVYNIYERWLHRYAPGTLYNTERVFGLRVPAGTPVTLSPREHTHHQWLPYLDAAAQCYSPSNAEAILMLPHVLGLTLVGGDGMTRIRLATYNIHKGVQGLGPVRRLEIHNLGHAVEQFDADIVCLQEVRKMHRREAQHFQHWPQQPQAEFLAPEGYNVVYRTNAVTRHGEHGNAMLSCWPVLAHQHEDMSDHRFEQRGLLHAEVQVHGRSVHVVVVHLGLIRASRVRQMEQLAQFIAREIPAAAPLLVAGDFNDWGALLNRPMAQVGLHSCSAHSTPTFPSRMPLVQFDHVYARGMTPLSQQVPKGRIWWRMSDHLPLIAEFELD